LSNTRIPSAGSTQRNIRYSMSTFTGKFVITTENGNTIVIRQAKT